MDDNNLLLDELNYALKEYYSKKNEKKAYNCLFTPLQKTSEFLSENGILIFPKRKYKKPNNELKNQYDEYLKNLKSKGEEARNKIWEDNIGLIFEVSKKIFCNFNESEKYNITFSEIISEGNFGLLESIEKYNPNLGVPFPPYAMRQITHRIERNLKEYLEIIRLPFGLIQLNKNMKYFKKNFVEKFGHSPNDKELADFMGKSVSRVENVKKYNALFRNPKSLNELSFDDNGKKEIIDSIFDENSCFEEDVINKITLTEFLEENLPKLSKIERIVLVGRLKSKTLEEIGIQNNFTKEWIRLVESKMMEKCGLKNKISENNI